jgi:predicted AAA+ superfamily ATPase
MINQLCKRIEKTKILFLNFEDERLELNSEELDLFLQSFMELYPHQNLNECYFFFDEIQNIFNWEKFTRRVYDIISKNIFITGSNSKLLSSEIATSLRGRTLSFEVFPLSFKEYLIFKDIEVDFYSSKSLAFIKNAQELFLKNGSFNGIKIGKNTLYDFLDYV